MRRCSQLLGITAVALLAGCTLRTNRIVRYTGLGLGTAGAAMIVAAERDSFDLDFGDYTTLIGTGILFAAVGGGMTIGSVLAYFGQPTRPR